MKILINTPRLIPQGGVANHYLGLRPYWNEQVLYNPIGKRGRKQGTGKYWMPLDLLVFIWRILFYSPNIILLNPSFSRSALVRDLIFLRVARFFRKPVAIFIHGFDKKTVQDIDLKYVVNCFNSCKCMFVLAKEFVDILVSWGVTVPIYLTTTKVDDNMLKGFDIGIRAGEVKTLLFLARITENKGVFIALDTFKILQQTHEELQLKIVGGGPDLERVKQYVAQNEIRNVFFTGPLDGEQVSEAFVQSDLYLFPTFHAEGMPTSVLEAMAFGLPVITRPVGGLVDFFVNGQMGEMIDSFDANDFALVVEKYLNDSILVKNVSMFNHEYATSHFLASEVAKSMESIFKEVVGV